MTPFAGVVRRVLIRGRFADALVLVTVATIVAALAALRLATESPFAGLVYGTERSPLVDTLLGTIGVDRTAVLVFLAEVSWPVLIGAGALTPAFIWIFGSTALHAAASMAGADAPLRPPFVLFGHAGAIARLPADLATVAAPVLAGPLAAVGLVILGIVGWSVLRVHYRLTAGRSALAMLLALVLFYMLPAMLIVVSLLAVIAAAMLLGLLPGAG